MKLGQDALGQPVDLSNCDREPIHIPGRVQPHGILLALQTPSLTITQISANVERILGLSPDDLLNQPLSSFLHEEERQRIVTWLQSEDLEESGPIRLRFGMEGRTVSFEGVAHRHDGVLILELENPGVSMDAPVQDFSREISKAMGRLQAAPELREFCQVAASELRNLTGFDRVIVYRFDHEWNGEVFAEDKKETLHPLMGLHFPASDIPDQARRLYHLNRIRLIADANAEPAPLVPQLNPQTGRPLDLSFSKLRSVSPIHIQYLKNMGACTAMSISLMREGRLWGLLSCMNYETPLFIPLNVRASCEFLGVLVSVQLAVKEDSEGFQYRHRLQGVRERLLQRMAEKTDLVNGLLGQEPDLLDLTAARGAAVVHDEIVAVVGETPDEIQIKRLVAWLKVHAENEVFQTDSLPRIYPPAHEFKDKGCGLMAISTSRSQGHYVLWFRPEVIQIVNWGGDPYKPVEFQDSSGQLSPRKSFELWREVVRLKSIPWDPSEIEAARALRNAIIAVVVRRAEELTRLNSELERSNSDLDAFAFTTSHDMKEPLRGIHNYATFLIEDYGDKLDEEGRARLHTLVRLSQRMEDLVDSMLQFSRLGRAEISRESIDVNEVVDEVIELHRMLLEESRATVKIPRKLPVVQGDRALLGQLYRNLITNAVKYNDKAEKIIEVGYLDPVKLPSLRLEPRSDSSSLPVFYVQDNGIGIPEKHYHAIFRLFKRLHGREKFGGGTGAGLTFAKKIVERHGGSLWVESALGVGSTFYFKLGS